MREKENVMRRLFILAFLLSGGLIVFILISKGEGRTKIEGIIQKEIPLSFSVWEGKEIALEEKVYSILETRDIIFREYRRKNEEPVWLLLVYCANNRAGFHPPEICFKGGSFQLEERSKVEVPLRDKRRLWVNRLLMRNGEETLLLYYWFTAGKDNFVNYYRQQLRLVLNQMRHKESYGTLVRVSTVVEGGDYEPAKKRVEEFCQELMNLFREFP